MPSMSGSDIFDRVAGSLREHGAKRDMKYGVLSDLLSEMQALGYTDVELSLHRYVGDPTIVEVFADKNIYIDDDATEAEMYDDGDDDEFIF